MDFFNLTLYDIYLCNDKKIILEIINALDSLNQRVLNKISYYHLYIKQLKLILYNNVDIESLNSSITFGMIYQEYEKFIIDNTSHIFLNNHLAILYPNIICCKATKPVTCNFSGEVIQKNSEYIYYRPLIDDLTTKRAYIVTPTIKCSTYHEQYLPKTILELEQFNNKLLNSYDSVDESINYYDISCNLGVDNFSLILLKKH